LASSHYPPRRRCIPRFLPDTNILLQGAFSLLVVLVAHVSFGSFTRPILYVGLIHFIAFGFDLAVFIVALTYPPYTNGCANSTYKGCEMLKAAIGFDAVLW